MTKNLKPNHSLARNFVTLYLDPSRSPEDIQISLGISRRTFYRLAADSRIPTLRLGVIAQSELPAKSPTHWNMYRSGMAPRGLKHDMTLALELGRRLACRLETRFLTSYEIQKKLSEDDLDLAVCSFTRLPGRFPKLLFSEPYLFESKPCGVLFAKKDRSLLISGRARAGFVNTTVHQHFALQNWPERFQWIGYSDLARAAEALREGRLEYLLCHPYYLNLPSEEFQIVGGPIFYGGSTAIAVTPAREDLRLELNRALDFLYERRFLQKLESHF